MGKQPLAFSILPLPRFYREHRGLGVGLLLLFSDESRWQKMSLWEAPKSPMRRGKRSREIYRTRIPAWMRTYLYWRYGPENNISLASATKFWISWAEKWGGHWLTHQDVSSASTWKISIVNAKQMRHMKEKEKKKSFFASGCPILLSDIVAFHLVL